MTYIDTGVSISKASASSGLSPKQIRYLEARNYIIPDYITAGSICQRRYSQELVDLLTEIARLREKGYELKIAVKLSRKELL